MSIGKILAFLKQVAMRGLVILLAVVLLMLVASRNVEFELQQNAEIEAAQTTPALTIR